MSGRRAITVALAGAGIWIAARLIGSSGLATIGIGLIALCALSLPFGRRSRRRLSARRRLSKTQVAPGESVRVEIDVTNTGAAGTSFLLLEDQLARELGPGSRIVLAGVPAQSTQTVSYEISPRTRGRHRIGPLSIYETDPFALRRAGTKFPETEILIVTPAVEDLRGAPRTILGVGHGASASRHLFRSGEEFSTMREYHEGDDLRRIHWPSVARSGELMIRQDESARRSSALVFLDTRRAALGRTRSPQFEKAVSAAASVGAFLARAGFALRLAAGRGASNSVAEEEFLETLAGVEDAPESVLRLDSIRPSAGSGATLVLATGLPGAHELAAITAAGTNFGSRIAVLVSPQESSGTAAPGPGPRPEFRRRASAAQLSLVRAGWEVFVLSPSEMLSPRWNAEQNRPAAAAYTR